MSERPKCARCGSTDPVDLALATPSGLHPNFCISFGSCADRVLAQRDEAMAALRACRDFLEGVPHAEGCTITKDALCTCGLNDADTAIKKALGEA